MENLNLKNENNHGITLIALIVTIVVLLILAGVTISAISGNESAMEKATEAKEKTNILNEKEAIQLAVINSMTGSGNNLSINADNLKQQLSGIIDETSLSNMDTTQTDWCLEGKTGEKYIIDEDGTVMTAYEKAKKVSILTENKPTAVIKQGNRVRASFDCKFSQENYTLLSYNIIYHNNGTINDISQLKVENIDGDSIKTFASSTFSGLLLDKNNGVLAVGYVKVQDPYGNEFILYTGDLGGSYAELSKESSATN